MKPKTQSLKNLVYTGSRRRLFNLLSRTIKALSKHGYSIVGFKTTEELCNMLLKYQIQIITNSKVLNNEDK